MIAFLINWSFLTFWEAQHLSKVWKLIIIIILWQTVPKEGTHSALWLDHPKTNSFRILSDHSSYVWNIYFIHKLESISDPIFVSIYSKLIKKFGGLNGMYVPLIERFFFRIIQIEYLVSIYPGKYCPETYENWPWTLQ